MILLLVMMVTEVSLAGVLTRYKFRTEVFSNYAILDLGDKVINLRDALDLLES